MSESSESEGDGDDVPESDEASEMRGSVAAEDDASSGDPLHPQRSEGRSGEDGDHRFPTLGSEWRQQVKEDLPAETGDAPEDGESAEASAPSKLSESAEPEGSSPAADDGSSGSSSPTSVERSADERSGGTTDAAAPVPDEADPETARAPRTNGASTHRVGETDSSARGAADPDEGLADDGLAEEEGLGERAELRRAVELLDELLELDPDNEGLHRRKAVYARRLEDTDVMAGTLRAWGGVMESNGEWRSAHFLYHRALELQPGEGQARAGLDRVLFQGKRASAGAANDATNEGTAALSDEKAGEELDWSDPGTVLRWELGRATEEVYRLQSAALRLLDSRQGSRDEVGARQAASEILGRYYVARQSFGRALRVMLPILTRTGIWDEDRKDTLYLCGYSFLHLGEEERSDECLARLAKVDDSFDAVLAVSGEA